MPSFLSGSKDESGPSAAAPDAYARAGVNLAARNEYVEQLKKLTASTNPNVLSGVGGFGAMYRLAGYRDPVLASSTDGVGTKIRIARIMERYDTIGEDLVNHCVNDILTTGASPLYFLDYLGSADIPNAIKTELITGMKAACHAHGCAFIGGETADMPDTYGEGALR